MKVSQADIQYAEQRAFEKLFPNGLWAHRKLGRPNSIWSITPESSKRALYVSLHLAINHRAGYSQLDGTTKRRYIWGNTLSIIRSKQRHDGEWRSLGESSQLEHAVLARRIIRGLNHANKSRISKRARYWAGALTGGLHIQ